MTPTTSQNVTKANVKERQIGPPDLLLTVIDSIDDADDFAKRDQGKCMRISLPSY